MTLTRVWYVIFNEEQQLKYTKKSTQRGIYEKTRSYLEMLDNHTDHREMFGIDINKSWNFYSASGAKTSYPSRAL